MPRGDCEGVGSTTRQPCCRRRGGGGGALVEPAALAALLSAGGYGYDLRRTIMERTDGEVDVDVGGLYRSLRRLEEEGAVVSRWCDDETGPRRREYQVTEQGIELAEQWLDALRQRAARGLAGRRPARHGSRGLRRPAIQLLSRLARDNCFT